LCITSNKAIKDWPEMLAGDEMITAALLDRLLHACHVLTIRGGATGCGTWRRT
jgi:DNA replication protein DnaC